LLACDLFLSETESLLEQGRGVQGVTQEFARSCLERFQTAVAVRAEIDGLRSREFACTLLAAIMGIDATVFLQVGDGAIVMSPRKEPKEYHWVFWPQTGEYENQTTFATDVSAVDNLKYGVAPYAIDDVALFSDGLQRLALHFETRTAHAPFFLPLFEALRAAPKGGENGLSSSLATFLGSQQINDRTDDDKTLILAARRDTIDSTLSKEDEQYRDGDATGC
jgi:hypothetical protein